MFVARVFDPTSGQVLRVPVPLDDSGLLHGNGCCALCQTEPVQVAAENPGFSSTSVPPSASAMVVSVVQGKLPELVHVPFIEVSEPEFVAGYASGASAYFEIVCDEEECRARYLTDQELVRKVKDIARQYWRLPLGEQDAWLAWVTGFLAGLISARIPSTLPLYGNGGACRQPVQACGHCPRCDTCTCPRPGGA